MPLTIAKRMYHGDNNYDIFSSAGKRFFIMGGHCRQVPYQIGYTDTLAQAVALVQGQCGNSAVGY
jgi:hypothetical protein